jgi:serine protease AprX
MLIRVRALAAAIFAGVVLQSAPTAQLQSWDAKLDLVLQTRAGAGGTSDVIVQFVDTDIVPDAVGQIGGTSKRALPLIRGHAARVPNAALAALAMNPFVTRVSIDRPIAGAMERTGATVGATAIRAELGYTGAGVGVAIIDSGITAWHDDLGDGNGGQRVRQFVDFVNGQPSPSDAYGHGTHVAGIIAGNGYDSSGARSGIAPGANLVVLKVLDQNGHGHISDVIAAIAYAVSNKDALNIRIINLSVATAVYESYETDPLTLAAREAVASGMVVVAAAGNNGRSPDGRMQYGGITAPGNAPWVLTVGASSHMGTIDRADDTIAAFSSRGPTAIDHIAKPDLVAPGVGIESLSAAGSTLYTTMGPYLLNGTVPTAYAPYLSLSGTSMAAPVVSGTVALMLQANPALTPNAVKAILQYTAQRYGGYDPLTQGAGFLDAASAVRLALGFARSDPSSVVPLPSWSGRITWGTRRYADGELRPGASAWSPFVLWGSNHPLDSGDPISWGVLGPNPWTLASQSRNVVWGNACGGSDCTGPWSIAAVNDGDTVVWGTSDGDTVVWGTNDGDTVVWGTSDGDTVVWGTSCSDPSCRPVVWNRP